MRINEEDNKLILEGDEGPLAELAYVAGQADAYYIYYKRIERILKDMIRLKEKENGKEK